MKATKHLAGLFALALTTPVFANQTINFTGSAAFRPAVLTAIKAAYTASGQPFQYVHDQTAGKLTSATNASFKGTFPGLSGTTIINGSFTGASSGVRSLVLGAADTFAVYYVDGLYTTAAAIGGGETARDDFPVAVGATAHTNQVSDIAFAESAATTPYGNAPLDTGANPVIGVSVYTFATNKGSPITNITSQQYRAVVTQGYQPLSAFTGNSADSSTLVFAEGRNDDSGVRTQALAETGYGITVPVQQYITAASGGGAITVLQLTPANSIYSSNIWGQDQAGNGGYTTGTTIRGDFTLTSSSVTIEDDQGNVELTGQPVWIVGTLASSDVSKVIGSGVIPLSYNGVGLDFGGSGSGLFSANDLKKIEQGVYSYWAYERQYIAHGEYGVKAGVATIADYVSNNVISQLATTVGGVTAQGIQLASMVASRSVDGGLVAP